MSQAHHEIHFEDYLVQQLVKQQWLEGTTAAYDQQRALYPEDVLSWLQTTQAKAWEKLVVLNGSAAATVLLDRLVKALEASTGGTMKVLREGLHIAGAGHIAMSQKEPEDARNATVNAHYEANLLRVVRQLKYCPTREFAIDCVFFINGIPVATVEVKTDFTQSVESAMTQYQEDRLPVDPKSKRKEPLLTFKRGAVVHFAVSDSDIRMTTKLEGKRTLFLPFNQGDNGHAGNAPRSDGEYPVAYFWEFILHPGIWLRIFHNFVYVETADQVDALGNPYRKETLIFPRYHQLEAVNAMIADAKCQGAGQQYLCEHSAGSGKTSTIAWTAHDLIKLRTPDGQAIFNAVIIVTDRNVLDAQLQDAVQQIDHQFGVICAIDRQTSNLPKSKQLAAALIKGVPIIVVTIQTFPYAMEAILTEQSLASKSFAVIVDEAHTSQTGSTAQGLRAVLSMESKANMDNMTVEELLLEIQKSRVRPKNVSHFAFTATPKHSTLTLFGRPNDPALPLSDTNKPVAFHRYTMRQAIEEGFILDVLENYLPYNVAYKLSESNIDDKRVDKKYARRSLAKWMALNETNVSKKVAFIIEHFRKNIAPLLNGEAKAMVVTSSRASAVKYKLAVDAYLQEHKLNDIQALVAFSGKVKGADLQDPKVDDNKEFSESSMNPSIGSKDLRHAFAEKEYRIMLVANKFQTGFNQPKLVGMYVDKKLSGIEAVQTFSRLNRTYAGKDKTFIVDFVNEPEVILSAFKQYDAGAQIESIQNADIVYDMQQILDDANIYNSHDLEAFKKVRDKSLLKGMDEALHKHLFSVTQRPTDVFNSKLKNLNDSIALWEKAFQKAYTEGNAAGQKQAEHHRSEFTKEREGLMRFKTELNRFVRTYNYIAQLIYFDDSNLENYAAFVQLLAKRLKGVAPEQIDLTGLLMTGCELKPNKEDVNYADIAVETLKPLGVNETPPNDREREFLSEIIKRLNHLLGDIAPNDDQQYFAAQIAQKTQSNDIVVEQINKNPKDQVMHGELPAVVIQSVIQAMSSHNAMATTLLKDPQVMKEFVDIIYDLVKSGNNLNLY